MAADYYTHSKSFTVPVSDEKLMQAWISGHYALAKATRATKEIDRSIRHKVIKQCRLVYINKTILSNLLEVLYSYRVLHNCTLCLQISDISAKIHHPFDLTK